MLTNVDFQELPGRKLVDADGSKIGTIDQLYADREDGHPTFVTVNTGLFGSRSSFVPLEQAEMRDEDVAVPYTKDQVKDAPNVAPDADLTVEEEDKLYEHYGLTRPVVETTAREPVVGTTAREPVVEEEVVETTAPGPVVAEDRAEYAGRDVSGPNTDDAMTRSEEEITVGSGKRETGKARLRKYVVTENVTKTVPVKHEEVKLEREPITEANKDKALDGPPISEEEHEITLHGEEPTVEKKVVPKERVRMGKEEVVEDETVSGEVAKEKIEAEGVYPAEGRTEVRETERRRR